VSSVRYSAALTCDAAEGLRTHLLQHIARRKRQEDLCFALWRPGTGRTRTTALVTEIILPRDGERDLHGGASFLPAYVERVIGAALEREAGITFLHSHFTPGWQAMSPDDVVAERRLAPRIFAATGLPLVGLTMGTDGALSARFWPRVGRGKFEREWCGTVRFVGDEFGVTFMERLAPTPAFKETLKRTRSAWGDEKQALMARLHVGVVGAGSVGALVAEALVRMGVETVTLIDFDKVEEHNLDRLLHATTADIGRLKVEVAADALRRHAMADNADIRAYPYSVTREDGLKAALDCDVLFSCVDRPWPRQVLNMTAYAHLIPVIDGGIRVRVTRSKTLRSADWRAHVALPGRPCLECLGQFDPADVGLERKGLLDDPSYIEGLPDDHFIHHNENVFGFAMNAAGLMILQFLSLVIQPSGVSDTGAHLYHFVNGALDKDNLEHCKPHCLFKDEIGSGDSFPYSLI
jgi:molybdopterin/thiamine biosynthesis adenylyltransferase